MNRPGGVLVIAILYWFAAFWLVLIGIVLALGATVFSAVTAGITAMLGGLGIAAGVFVIAFGAAFAFEGYGLFTMQEWARVVAVVLSVIALVFTVLSLVSPMHVTIVGRLIRLAVNGTIVWYLNQPQVRGVFRRA
jgi:uncharacterized membrane protein (DUF2068 family)